MKSIFESLRLKIAELLVKLCFFIIGGISIFFHSKEIVIYVQKLQIEHLFTENFTYKDCQCFISVSKNSVKGYTKKSFLLGRKTKCMTHLQISIAHCETQL